MALLFLFYLANEGLDRPLFAAGGVPSTSGPNQQQLQQQTKYNPTFLNENDMRQQNNQLKRIFASSFQPTKNSSIRKLKYFFGEKVNKTKK